MEIIKNHREKELFGRFKHNLPIDRAPKFIKFLKDNDPLREPHHLLGSQGRIKLTDYLIVMVDRRHHDYAEKHKIMFFFENLHWAIQNLISYIKFLGG